MKTLFVCACLVLVATPSLSFFVRKTSVEIDADDGQDWLALESLLGGKTTDKQTCAAKEKKKSSCGCKENLCACCILEKKIFGNKNSDACIGVMYLEDGDDYRIAISENGEELYRHRVNRNGLDNIQEHVSDKMKSIDAELTLTIDCQEKPKKGELNGCLRLNGGYKVNKLDEKVNADFGCFKLKF